MPDLARSPTALLCACDAASRRARMIDGSSTAQPRPAALSAMRGVQG